MTNHELPPWMLRSLERDELEQREHDEDVARTEFNASFAGPTHELDAQECKERISLRREQMRDIRIRLEQLANRSHHLRRLDTQIETELDELYDHLRRCAG